MVDISDNQLLNLFYKFAHEKYEEMIDNIKSQLEEKKEQNVWSEYSEYQNAWIDYCYNVQQGTDFSFYAEACKEYIVMFCRTEILKLSDFEIKILWLMREHGELYENPDDENKIGIVDLMTMKRDTIEEL